MRLGKSQIAQVPLASSGDITIDDASTLNSILISAKTDALVHGENTIRIWVDDASANAVAIKLTVDTTMLSSIFYGDTTMIDGGRIHAGSTITIGNTAGAPGYSVLSAQGLEFFPYIGGEHRLSKYLRGLEFGYADSGETVTIPGHWVTKPALQLSPRIAPTSDPAYNTQRQNLVCYYDDDEFVSTSAGKWQFVPRMKLTTDPGNIISIIDQEEELPITGSVIRGGIYETLGTEVPVNELAVETLTVLGKYGAGALVTRSAIESDANGTVDPGGSTWHPQPFRARLEYKVNGSFLYSPWVEYGWDIEEIPDHSLLNNFSITVSVTAPDEITGFRLNIQQQYYDHTVSDFQVTDIELRNFANVSNYSANFDEGTLIATGSVNWIAIGE